MKNKIVDSNESNNDGGTQKKKKEKRLSLMNADQYVANDKLRI